ncbi:hypothetical protein ACFSTD_04885 [Novosphingobium colocasiae]
MLACLALGMACWPAMAHAEAETDAWTGDIGLYSRYLDYDLFPLTPPARSSRARSITSSAKGARAWRGAATA